MLSISRRLKTKLLKCLVVASLSIAASLPLLVSNLRYFYQEDDAHHFNRTIEMAKQGDLHPHYFNKPALHFYLRIPLVYLATWYDSFRGRGDTLSEIRTRDPYGLAGYAFTPSHPYILALLRGESVVWSSMLAVATALLVGLLRHSLRVAFAAALLVIASPEVLRNSYIIGVDTLMALLCLATTCYGCWLLGSKSSNLRLAVCAFLAGAACAAKYNAAPIVVVPLGVWWLRQRSFKGLLIACSVPLVGFLALAPYSLIEWREFMAGVSYERWHYGVAGHVGHTSEPGWPQALLYLRWMLSDGVGVGASVLALLGGVWLSVYNREAFLLITSFPALYALLMISQRAHFTRNMVVIVPYLAVLAGVGLAALNRLISSRGMQHLALAAVSFVAIWPIAVRSYGLSVEALRADESRRQLLGWINDKTSSSDRERFTGDIAISGALQMPIGIFNLPGVDAFNPSKMTVADLVQTGYEYVIVPRGAKVLDPDLFDLESRIDGDVTWPQRVPRNPAIDILRVRPVIVDRVRRLASLNLKLKLADNGALLGQCAEAAQEGYCWLSSRITNLEISGQSSLRQIYLEIKTPWKRQKVSLIDGRGEVLVSEAQVSEAAGEEWLRYELPGALIRDKSQILIAISDVHSPASWGLNADRRRLGVAVRAE
jgi:hypothetical protein